MFSRIVYIVDDDEWVRDSVSFFLKSMGYIAESFSGGRSFLGTLASLQPGCVLLDMRMAEIDGFEVIEKLKNRRAQFPALVMTGHGDVVTAVRAMRLGACDVMQKPFEEGVLVEMLERQFVLLSHQVLEDGKRRAAREQIGGLTGREIAVLEGLSAGCSNKVLAYKLGLSTRTVEMHRANMLNRLRVRTLPEALKLAFEAGINLLSPPSTVCDAMSPAV